MSLLDNPVIAALSRALDLTAQRQVLLTQNVANIDTPGYHARDIDFGQELQRALSSAEDEQGDQDEAGRPALVREVPGLVERPDGNNVNIDRESLLMGQNQLQFQTDVALLRSEFSRLQEAIQGGSTQ
jgi:flagellar basal-body rod protein FlgB